MQNILVKIPIFYLFIHLFIFFFFGGGGGGGGGLIDLDLQG